MLIPCLGEFSGAIAVSAPGVPRHVLGFQATLTAAPLRPRSWSQGRRDSSSSEGSSAQGVLSRGKEQNGEPWAAMEPRWPQVPGDEMADTLRQARDAIWGYKLLPREN